MIIVVTSVLEKKKGDIILKFVYMNAPRSYKNVRARKN